VHQLLGRHRDHDVLDLARVAPEVLPEARVAVDDDVDGVDLSGPEHREQRLALDVGDDRRLGEESLRVAQRDRGPDDHGLVRVVDDLDVESTRRLRERRAPRDDRERRGDHRRDPPSDSVSTTCCSYHRRPLLLTEYPARRRSVKTCSRSRPASTSGRARGSCVRSARAPTGAVAQPLDLLVGARRCASSARGCRQAHRSAARRGVTPACEGDYDSAGGELSGAASTYDEHDTDQNERHTDRQVRALIARKGDEHQPDGDERKATSDRLVHCVTPPVRCYFPGRGSMPLDPAMAAGRLKLLRVFGMRSGVYPSRRAHDYTSGR